MASCHKCGKGKIRKRRDGAKKCRRCGFLTYYEPITENIMTKQPKANDVPQQAGAQPHAEKKQVVTQSKGTEVSLYDYSAFAGQGFEAHTRDDYAVPFLGVLQSNSPLVETSGTAKAGMLVNTVTQDLYDGSKGVTFIPVDTDHVVVEWIPRNQGGGLAAIHKLDSEIVVKAKAEQEFGKWKAVKGDLKSNDLIETFYVYGLFVHESGAAEQMIMTFSSTKIKVYKRWMTKARTVQAPKPGGGRQILPLFAHKYKIRSVSEKNADGSFYNFQIDWDGADAETSRLAPNDSLFMDAVDFFKLIREGNIKAAYDSQTEVGADPKDASNPTPFK